MPSPRTKSVPSPRLTTLSHGAGCACKLPAAELRPLLDKLASSQDPAVIVASEEADDAAVYRLSEELAIVSTVDFFTPVVDDPYDFGRVAAANAISDVYAMGGRPVLALNLVAWSLESAGDGALEDVLRGGAAVAAEAGAAVVGGHSIDDPEPKFGMAVTGTVHPDRIVRNSTARPGDELYLTKPVGGGVISTAAKRGLAAEQVVESAVEVMCELNGPASEAAVAAGASAMTDVTGFGLLGHLHELSSASGTAAELEAAAVPALPGALDLLVSEEPPIAGGSRRNRDWVEGSVEWSPGVAEERRWLLCDAMTSGGLLVAVPQGSSAPGVRVGRVVEGEAGRIAVR